MQGKADFPYSRDIKFSPFNRKLRRQEDQKPMTWTIGAEGLKIRTAALCHEKSGVRFSGRSNRARGRQRLATAAAFLRSCVAETLSSGNGLRHSLYASG